MASGTIKNREWRLVWENPNPSSEFGAQTVPMDLSSYSEVLIQYWRPNISQYQMDSYASVWGLVGQKIFMQLAYYQLTWRSATIATDGITFSNGCLTVAMNQSINENAPGYAVPVRVYAR